VYVVILANTTGEAMTYAQAKKLPRGGFRYAARASTVKGLRVAEIHILPGFARRPDRFAIKAALRYTRAKYVEVSPEEYDQLVSAYPLERAARIAFRYQAIEEASRGQEAGETEPGEDAAPAAPRRSAPRKRKEGPKPAPRPLFNEDGTEAKPVEPAGMFL
jgi:hypothetical protein